MSRKNYVYNHIGHFAFTQEAMCRSLFMGGVFRRFPGLRFAFLEGGVGWACQLFSDLVGHFKRKWDEVVKFDPREFDLDLARELLAAFSEGRMASQAERYCGRYPGEEAKTRRESVRRRRLGRGPG